MYIHRAIEETLRTISNTFPVLLVTGPRQVGKSTLLNQLMNENRTVISLDDLEIRKLAKEDPALFMQRYRPPLLIDEVQYAPELFPYIKLAVDSSHKNGDFWLTGSQAFQLMEGVSESLAGRVGVINLLGLSENEIRGSSSTPFVVNPDELIQRSQKLEEQNISDVFERIFLGSFPRLYADNAPNRDIYFESYIQTYIQRDVRKLTQVANELAFQTFMIAVAARTARPLVYDELANEVGVSAPTVKKWISILRTSGLVTLVQPYHNNILKRATKMPLLHFMDTGLAAYLLKWTSPETLETGAMSGQFFESYVFSELYKSYLNTGKEPPFFYYRDKEKREIDLLINQNNTLHPIEIKKSASPGKEAIKNFRALDALKGSKTTVGTGCVICMSNNIIPLDENNWQVPVWLI